MMRSAFVLIAAAGLSACSPQGEPAGESADEFAGRAGVAGGSAQTAGAGPAAAQDVQAVAAPGGKPRLTPLASTSYRVLGKTSGRCTFAYGGKALLTVGAPDDIADKGKGVLVVDERQMVLAGVDAGGPQVVESGPTLTDGTWTASVQRAEGSPEPAGGGNRWSADLVVRGPGGESRFSPGTWTCSL